MEEELIYRQRGFGETALGTLVILTLVGLALLFLLPPFALILGVTIVYLLYEGLPLVFDTIKITNKRVRINKGILERENKSIYLDDIRGTELETSITEIFNEVQIHGISGEVWEFETFEYRNLIGILEEVVHEHKHGDVDSLVGEYLDEENN